MHALKAVDVSMAYSKGAAKRDVLKNFSLEIDSGSFTSLMGPSGSGKSTFSAISLVDFWMKLL